MDDLHVVMPMIGPWQRSRVDELGTKNAWSIAEFVFELTLKLGERRRIPMEVLGGTGFVWNTFERVLREHFSGNSEARGNREIA